MTLCKILLSVAVSAVVIEGYPFNVTKSEQVINHELFSTIIDVQSTGCQVFQVCTVLSCVTGDFPIILLLSTAAR